jgi:hypothetical protein
MHSTAAPIHICLGASQHLAHLITVMHALALISCWPNALPLPVQLILSGLVLLSGHHHRQPQASIGCRLRYSPQSAWTFSPPDSDFISIEILPSSVICAWACVIHYRHATGTRQLLVMHDALAADDFRRLKVQLKITANSTTSHSPSG